MSTQQTTTSFDLKKIAIIALVALVALIVIGVGWAIVVNIKFLFGAVSTLILLGLVGYKCYTGRPAIFGPFAQLAAVLFIALSVAFFYSAKLSYDSLSGLSAEQIEALVMGIFSIEQDFYDLAVAPWLTGFVPFLGFGLPLVLVLLGLIFLLIGAVVGVIGEVTSAVVDSSWSLCSVKNKIGRLDKLESLDQLSEISQIRYEVNAVGKQIEAAAEKLNTAPPND